jgi:hypothetical protein
MTHWSRRIIVLLPLVLATAAGIYLTTRMAWADLQYSAATTELSFWRRQSYQPQPQRVAKVSRQLALAQQLDANNPDYLQASAELARWQASWATEPQQRADYQQRSLTLQWQALVARPGQQSDWSRYLGDKAHHGDYDQRWQLARQQLQMLNKAP